MNDVIARLQNRLDKAQAERRRILDGVKDDARETLNTEEEAEFRRASDDIRLIEERLAELAEEDQRSYRSAAAQRRAAGEPEDRGGRAVGAVAPVVLDRRDVRAAFDAVQRRQPAAIESRAVTAYPVESQYRPTPASSVCAVSRPASSDCCRCSC